VLGLQGIHVMAYAGDEIVTAGRELENRDIGGRPHGRCLVQEVFGVAVESVQSLLHIRLIDLGGEDLSYLEEDCTTESSLELRGLRRSLGRPQKAMVCPTEARFLSRRLAR
jgi:hypothetical protein